MNRDDADRKALRCIAVVGLIAAGVVAAIAAVPALDLAAAGAIWMRPTPDWIEAARRIAYPAPYLAAGLLALIWIARAARGRGPFPGRAALFVALTLALGPGLIVNFGMKTHIPRARPAQTADIVGAGAPFRPFTDFAGPCARNCSFPSGETSAAFSTLAPALAAEGSLGPVLAALAFGVGIGALRMAAGAHFLSDVAFSAALMCALVLALRRLLLARGPEVRERGDKFPPTARHPTEDQC